MFRTCVSIFGLIAAVIFCASPAGAQQVCEESFVDFGLAGDRIASEQLGESIKILHDRMRRDPMYRLVPRTRDYQTFIDATGLVLWSFTTPTHPAYPTAVCRQAYRNGSGSWFMTMRVSCFGTTPDCDQLVEYFNRLNAAARDHLQKQFPDP